MFLRVLEFSEYSSLINDYMPIFEEDDRSEEVKDMCFVVILDRNFINKFRYLIGYLFHQILVVQNVLIVCEKFIEKQYCFTIMSLSHLYFVILSYQNA